MLIRPNDLDPDEAGAVMEAQVPELGQGRPPGL